MSLQRRLLLYLLLSAPLVWALAAAFSAVWARAEVNELFDTDMVRLARQVQVITVGGRWEPVGPAQMPARAPLLGGEADLADLALAVWDRQGRVVAVDREGVELPWRRDASGFVDATLEAEPWRLYYLQSPQGDWLIAVGQRMHERDELVWGLVGGQLLPWLLVLPVLLAAMVWAVRHALAPVRAVAGELKERRADDLRSVPVATAPAELQPLLQAMNGLFLRVGETLARERRFTADAAHELRTPISVLAAQWAVLRGAAAEAEREKAAQGLDAGLQRLSRVVDQMLNLSRLDATERLPDPRPIDWPRLVEQVMSDALPLAERRQIELACEWNGGGADNDPPRTPAWAGDFHLFVLLLRNLLDNAVRYAPARSLVTLRFSPTTLVVENDATPEALQGMGEWGERFHRPDGQSESGSGLGVSIARRIASLHGLSLVHRRSADGRRVLAELSAQTPWPASS